MIDADPGGFLLRAIFPESSGKVGLIFYKVACSARGGTQKAEESTDKLLDKGEGVENPKIL